jgi:AP-4 complex subunit epsilon-1
VLLLVNTLLSDLKSDNFVVVASALVVTSKLIGPDLVNAGACILLIE